MSLFEMKEERQGNSGVKSFSFQLSIIYPLKLFFLRKFSVKFVLFQHRNIQEKMIFTKIYCSSYFTVEFSDISIYTFLLFFFYE